MEHVQTLGEDTEFSIYSVNDKYHVVRMNGEFQIVGRPEGSGCACGKWDDENAVRRCCYSRGGMGYKTLAAARACANKYIND